MFTEKFISLLQSKSITAYRVAKETGISQGLMNGYKNGKSIPSLQNMEKIAKYLGCSVDYFLDNGNEDSSAETEMKQTINVIQVARKNGQTIEEHLTDEQVDACLAFIKLLIKPDL